MRPSVVVGRSASASVGAYVPTGCAAMKPAHRPNQVVRERSLGRDQLDNNESLRDQLKKCSARARALSWRNSRPRLLVIGERQIRAARASKWTVRVSCTSSSREFFDKLCGAQRNRLAPTVEGVLLASTVIMSVFRLAGMDVRTGYAAAFGCVCLVIAGLCANCDAIVGTGPTTDGRQVTQSVRQPARQAGPAAKPERAGRAREDDKQRSSKDGLVMALLLLLSGLHR